MGSLWGSGLRGRKHRRSMGNRSVERYVRHDVMKERSSSPSQDLFKTTFPSRVTRLDMSCLPGQWSPGSREVDVFRGRAKLTGPMIVACQWNYTDEDVSKDIPILSVLPMSTVACPNPKVSRDAGAYRSEGQCVPDPLQRGQQSMMREGHYEEKSASTVLTTSIDVEPLDKAIPFRATA